LADKRLNRHGANLHREDVVMTDLMAFLSTPWLWFIVAALLLGGELLLPGVFLLWLALAAALTGIIDLALDLSWTVEIVVFAVASLGLVLASWRFVMAQRRPKSDQPFLNQRHHAYVGQNAVLVKAIENGHGKVNFEDALWDVRGPDLPMGARVRVTGVEGMALKVEAAPL
jgi:inner membrane protein